MKKILNVIIGLTLLVSCQTKKETLELNLTKGETYSQSTTVNSSILQTINGQQINMNMSIDSKMTYKVIDIQNSVYEMEVQYKTIEMKMNLPSREIIFSSEKNDENDIFSTMLGMMINKPFWIKMTKSGKVNEVKNIESLFSNLFDGFPNLSDIQKQQMKAQLMQTYGEKSFKGNMEMCSAIFPDLPVSKGEKWTVNIQIEAGMSGTMETAYQLKDVTDSCYQIIGDSKIKTADKDAYIESNGMPMKYDLTGTMLSDIKIDKETGWVLSAKMNQSISGTAYIKESPQIPGGMAVPMTINSETIISGK